MTLRHPLVALLLSLCLMLGAVGDAVARAEMAGMSELVLCGAGGQTTVTLDSHGQPVPRHPCTHCLAATGLALTAPPPRLQPPGPRRVERLHPAPALWLIQSASPCPHARGPPPHMA